MIIYYIKVENKYYIGQTKQSLKIRIHNHMRDRFKLKTYFYSVLINYEICNIEYGILEEFEDIKLADEKEKYWINFYDSYNNGYNSTLGGIGSLGLKWSKEQIFNRPNLSSNDINIIKEIKTKLSEGIPIYKLSEEYNINRNVVSNIKQCICYEYILPELNSLLLSKVNKLNFDLEKYIIEIKTDLYNNVDKKEIRKKYNIDSKKLYAIIKGLRYRHVLKEFNEIILNNYFKI